MPPGTLFKPSRMASAGPRRNDQSNGSRKQDVPLRKLILRAFAAADAVCKSAGSLASSVQLKAQAKLIADPEGEGKPTGKPTALHRRRSAGGWACVAYFTNPITEQKND